MRKLQKHRGMRQLNQALAAGAILTGLTACASERVVYVSRPGLMKPIEWTCDEVTGASRARVIKHNASVDGVKAGKPVVYQDDCPKPAAPKASAAS